MYAGFPPTNIFVFKFVYLDLIITSVTFDKANSDLFVEVMQTYSIPHCVAVISQTVHSGDCPEVDLCG